MNPNPSITTRFKPGQSGNPGGKAKGVSLLGEITRQLAIVPPHSNKTNAEHVISALIRKARGGNVPAITCLLDRLHGKPSQSINLDMDTSDWRTLAENLNLTETDVREQARLLIESCHDSVSPGSSGSETPT